MRFGKKRDVRFQLCIKPTGFLVLFCWSLSTLLSDFLNAACSSVKSDSGATSTASVMLGVCLWHVEVEKYWLLRPSNEVIIRKLAVFRSAMTKSNLGKPVEFPRNSANYVITWQISVSPIAFHYLSKLDSFIFQQKQGANGGTRNVPRPLFWEMYYIYHAPLTCIFIYTQWPFSMGEMHFPPFAYCAVDCTLFSFAGGAYFRSLESPYWLLLAISSNFWQLAGTYEWYFALICM